MRALLVSPTLHFVVLGALVFAGERLLLPALLEASSLHARNAAALSSESPQRDAAGPVQRSSVADGSAREEMLVREALAAGLDRTDALVRDRLARLGESIASEDLQDREALERQARRLGLDRTDPVVRRRLAHAMELALSHLGPDDLPSEDEARAFHASHPDRYRQPARARFHHVYFARDREGVPAQQAAIAALELLRTNADVADSPIGGAHESAGARTAAAANGAKPFAAVHATDSASHAHQSADARAADAANGTHQSAGEPTADARILGDAFLLGDELNLSAAEAARRFGVEFAAAIEDARVGNWTGPLASTYGLHIVHVIERIPAGDADFEAVRGRVVHDLLAERRAQKLELRLAQRRAAPSDSRF